MRFRLTAAFIVIALSACASQQQVEDTPVTATAVANDEARATQPESIEALDSQDTAPVAVITEELPPVVEISANDEKLLASLCEEVGNKLGSVDVEECQGHQLVATAGRSLQGRMLAYKPYLPKPERDPLGRVLVIGGIHGDEFSSVSVVFKWMEILDKHHSGLFHWRFIPVSNPDGLLASKSTRQNAAGVDLNRNFPTVNWSQLALPYWRNKTGENARRYPGPDAGSEPETSWLLEQIAIFDPDIIISMHAPYHLVDYDGPPKAPDQLGSLYLRRLGVYPGSLGNYAGVDLGLPIVTVELASAGIMPSDEEIASMWDDLVRWLRDKTTTGDRSS